MLLSLLPLPTPHQPRFFPDLSPHLPHQTLNEKEEERGWVERLPDGCLDDEDLVFFRSFVAMQTKWDRDNKPDGTWHVSPRRIDDGRASGLNETTICWTHVKVASLDTLAVVGNRFIAADQHPDGGYKAVKLDHESAYRQLVCKDREKSGYARVILSICPTSGKPVGWLAHRCLFGERASVTHYNAFALTLTLLVHAALISGLLQYYDDFIAVGRSGDDKLKADLIEFLGDVLETAFNHEKSEDGQTVGHLGAVCTFGMEGIWFSISSPRREKLLWHVHHHLETDTMTPGEAASLAGRLSWRGAASSLVNVNSVSGTPLAACSRPVLGCSGPLAASSGRPRRQLEPPERLGAADARGVVERRTRRPPPEDWSKKFWHTVAKVSRPCYLQNVLNV